MKTLLEHAAEVDVLDLSGRIIANPRRVRVSTADCLALAHAVEAFWAVCLEADILIRALALPTETFTREEDFAVRDHAIQTQADTIARQLAVLRGEPQGEQS